jgi:hypothetical protein
VPALVAGAGGPDAPAVPPASYLLVVATAGVGLLAVTVWWDRADHTG